MLDTLELPTGLLLPLLPKQAAAVFQLVSRAASRAQRGTCSIKSFTVDEGLLFGLDGNMQSLS